MNEILTTSINSSKYNNSTILDNIALSHSSNPSTCQSVQITYRICRGCNTVYRFEAGCHKKTCPACQKKRQYKLYNQYKAMVESWQPTATKKINFLTLTFLNQPDITKEYLTACDKKLTNFRQRLKRKGYLPEYGFICKEMTVGNKGYHYHYHLLFYGDYIDLKNPDFNLSKIWKDVTEDSYMIKLFSQFDNGNLALNYTLKYVTKPQTQEIQKYYDLTKHTRNFNTFGKFYGNKPKAEKKPELICPKCESRFIRSSPYSTRFDIIPEHYKEFPIEKFNYRLLRIKMQIKTPVIEYKAEIQVKITDDYDLTAEERLLAKIRTQLQAKHNRDEIETILTDQELQFLIKNGCIYLCRSDMYKELT